MNRILSIFLFPILVLFSVHIESSGYSAAERASGTSSDYDNNNSLEVVLHISSDAVVSPFPNSPCHELVVFLAETEIQQQEVNGARKHFELSTFFTTDTSISSRITHQATFNRSSFTGHVSNSLSQRYHIVLGVFRI